MKMVSDNLKSQKSATQKSLFQRLRLLRIKVFTENFRKITLTINRVSFTECSQTLAKQLMQT